MGKATEGRRQGDDEANFRHIEIKASAEYPSGHVSVSFTHL